MTYFIFGAGLTLAVAAGGAPWLAPTPAPPPPSFTQRVERFAVYEGRFQASKSHSNPFKVWCDVYFQSDLHPSGVKVPMFHDGGDEWAFRFAPNETGTWTFSSACPDDTGLDGQAGSLEVVEGSGRGGLRGHPARTHRFAREDGSAHMPVGIELDWLYALGLEDRDLEGFVAHIGSFGFNHFLVNVYSNYADWNRHLPDRQDPRVSPTIETPWASSDQKTLDLDFFRNWDRVLQLLTESDIVTHLMIYVGNKNVDWPEAMGDADDIYFKHVLARFGAYNVVLDVSKEANRFDSDYMLNRLRLIHTMNPHRRLVTAHTGIPSYGYNNCPEDLCSMITRQKHFDGDVTDQAPHYYGDTIAAAEAHPVPVINAEFFYEAGQERGCKGSARSSSGNETCAVTHDELKLMRMTMWDIYMAGGTAAWYQCDISWDYIQRDTTSSGMKWMKHLSDFWAGVDFADLEPRDDLVSVDNGATVHCAASADEFVVFTHSSASFSLDVPEGVSGKWFDPRTGEEILVSSVTGSLTPPFPGDVVLHLRTAKSVV